MAVEVFYDANVILGSYDLTGDTNTVKVDQKVDMLEKVCFGYTEKRFQPGLRAVDADFSGYVQFDDSVTPKTVDFQLQSLVGGVEKPFTISQASVVNSVAYLGSGLMESYSFSLAPADLGKFDAKLKGSNISTRGRLVLPFAARVASGTSASASTVGAASSTQRVVACLHVTEFIGTSLIVVVKSAPTAVVAGGTSRLTFATASGVTSEMAQTAVGAITDAYYYADFTFVGTSFKAAVSVGIR